jgi:CRISPR-associated protein Csm1
MIILGDISGIQRYLFDVAEAGGGQARRLRARSFFIQAVAEAAALRILRAVGWPLDESHFLQSGAGKFILRGSVTGETAEQLEREQGAVNDWLLQRTRAELRLTLAWADSDVDVTAYRKAQSELQKRKSRPWTPALDAGWDHSRLILPPLNTPCVLCGHAPGEIDERDPDDGETRRVCRTCADNADLGRRLPRSRWLAIRASPQGNDLDLFGLGLSISNADKVTVGPDTIAVMNLTNPESRPPWCPVEHFLKRRLMAYVPTTADGAPVWFVDLAKQARGDQLLAVLKADADSLGVAIEKCLAGSDLFSLRQLSNELDRFFAGRLKEEIESTREPRWKTIYTIFAGGDDLVMVGPWDVMIDFAGRMHELFQQEFRSRDLTISAGLALMKPKRPIKAVADEAERLLERAKMIPAPGASAPKNQLSAFGQCWKWEDHAAIIRQARQLAEWVERGKMERGWLHTLLELAEARDPLASSRLAYHVTRNYRDNDVRRWGRQLSERFDNKTCLEVRYLPAILRYALTATRTRTEED